MCIRDSLYLGKFQVKEIQFPHGMVDTGENITNVELVLSLIHI